MEYNLLKPWKTLFPWQKKFLEETGNAVLKCGRQTGKSTIVSIKAGEAAVKKPHQIIMIVAKTERQALLLFEKTYNYLFETKRDMIIEKGKFKPTKHEMRLTNGSQIMARPTGIAGYGIRGYALTHLIVDEAPLVPIEVWTSIEPMVATRIKTGAQVILLGTPLGRKDKEGDDTHFYRCWQDDRYTNFSVTTEECETVDQEWLADQKTTMSKVRYAQEYLAEFMDELCQVFSVELIDKCQTENRTGPRQEAYFLGCDFARFGEDETTFEILKKAEDQVTHVEHIVLKEVPSTQIRDRILSLDRIWKFKKIGLDTGGIGGPIYDFLLEQPQVRKKLVDLDNSKRSLTINEDEKLMSRTTGLVKEALYENLLAMMDWGRLKLLKDENIKESLQSIQWEIKKNGYPKIVGSYSHIAEGLIRAAWLARNQKVNKLWISYI